MAWAPRWLRVRTGVRVASALSAAAVVAVALLIGGAALLLLVDRSLTHSVQDDALQRATAIAERMHGNYGRKTPVPGGDRQYTPKENAVEALDALARGDEQWAQVLVDYSNTAIPDYHLIRASSAATDDAPMTLSLTPRPERTAVDDGEVIRDAQGSQHRVVIAAAGGTTTTPDPTDYVVLYAASLAPVDVALTALAKGLLLGVPILILVAGAATYVFAGRALRPVEAIRARVAEMSEKDLSQRVPVPASRDEVHSLAETMNGLIARLEDAQVVQRRFVADASHELRSPLATIGAGLELLQSGPADAATVATLRGETERIGRLVDDLLLLARADERGMRPRREEVDLDEVAEAERLRPADGGVTTEVRAEHVRVIGDRGQLVRVLRNLVDNARRHAASRVLVTVKRDGEEAVLEVADDGPGVPEADRARVFERFVRLDDARARSDGGSGLGLSIVAEVVAAHEGTVVVDAAPGGGALFRVRLPAAAAVEADPDDAALDAVPADADVVAVTAGTGPGSSVRNGGVAPARVAASPAGADGTSVGAGPDPGVRNGDGAPARVPASPVGADGIAVAAGPGPATGDGGAAPVHVAASPVSADSGANGQSRAVGAPASENGHAAPSPGGPTELPARADVPSPAPRPGPRRPRPGVHRVHPARRRPVTDADARRDPGTSPAGIPIVEPAADPAAAHPS